MAKQYLRLTFYGREAPVHVEIGDVDAEDIISGVKGLAAGGKDIQAFYLFPIGGDLSALISVQEIQTLQFTKKPNGDWKPAALKGGVAFYLKGRDQPLELDYSGHGPLDDMFHGLADTRYGEELPGCIMLSDGSGEPSFFRMDEIQFAVAKSSLIKRLS
ncbi:MAG TPA: hypothetical protein VGM16_05430 [Gammaproteobacteria bacterium]|jgi:hypothetical protein